MLQTHDIDGYPLAYLAAGRGEPVLLIHGSVSDYRAWAQQMDDFAAHHRVIAVSLRQCHPERWDGRGDGFSVARHVADLARFIPECAGGPVHLVGHSRGGAIAIQLALHHGALVRSLVLADPGGLEALLPETEEGRRMAAQAAAMFQRLGEDLARGDVEVAARHFADTLGGAGSWDRRTAAQRQMLLDNLATGPACAERPRPSREALATIAVPTLLVTGERSPPRYALELAALQRCCAAVRGVVTIPDAAHAVQRENPAAFNRAVLAFLAAVH